MGDKRLVSTVPMIPRYRLSSVPEFMTREQFNQFLQTARRSPLERRDTVVLSCPVGLRVHGGPALNRAIRWRDGVVDIHSDKTRRSTSCRYRKMSGPSSRI